MGLGSNCERLSSLPPYSRRILLNFCPTHFTSTTEEEANNRIKGLNIKYVIIDRTLLEGKWYAVVDRAGLEEMDVQDSFLWILWNEQALGYTKVYERGDIKIYEQTGNPAP